jgi:hypothetical protein
MRTPIHTGSSAPTGTDRSGATEGLVLFFKLNLWLCSMSVLMLVVTAHALGIDFSAVGLGFALPPLLFYFIYVEDRRSVSPEDYVNQPIRTALVTRYRRGLLVTELIALVGYEGLVIYYVVGPPRQSLWFLLLAQVPFAVLAAYDSVKRVPAGDSLAVGTTWAYANVFAVVVSTGLPLSTSVGLAFLGWTSIVVAGVESRNVHDASGDATAEKTTLAGYLGPRMAKALEAVLKAVGVVLFWLLSGPVSACLVVGYLLGLRSCRGLTERVDAMVGR